MIREIEETISTLESLKKHKAYKEDTNTPEPSFSPDLELGEGEADDSEIEYRESLINELEDLYKIIYPITISTSAFKVKEAKINEALTSFENRTKEVMNSITNETWEAGVENGNTTLQDVLGTKRKFKGDEERLKVIQGEQEINIKDITNFLTGRLLVGLAVIDVYQFYEGSPDYNFINGGFNTAQSRLDKMGMYGHTHTNMQSYLSALRAGANVLDKILIADWVTWGDSHVCDDCQDLEANGPYLLSAWPQEPHFGCRCERGDVRVE